MGGKGRSSCADTVYYNKRIHSDAKLETKGKGFGDKVREGLREEPPQTPPTRGSGELRGQRQGEAPPAAVSLRVGPPGTVMSKVALRAPPVAAPIPPA